VVGLLAFYIPEVRVKWIYFCPGEVEVKFSHFSFGSRQIDGAMYEHDIVIDRGEILKRKKKLSKRFQGDFGHTPLAAQQYSNNVPP
jgi:hypothetical protein